MQTRPHGSQAAYVGPRSPAQAFTHPRSHPGLLTVLLLGEFGREFLAWEPQTLWFEINRTWGQDPAVANRSKIQACRTILVADSPFEQWEIFEAVAFGLVGLSPRFDLIQKCSGFKCIFALDTMKQLRAKTDIAPEIYKYCAASLHAEGFAYAPGSLRPANTFLRELVPPEVVRAVGLAFEAESPARLPRGSAIALQTQKSRAVARFSEIQRAALTQQLAQVKSRGI